MSSNLAESPIRPLESTRAAADAESISELVVQDTTFNLANWRRLRQRHPASRADPA